MASAGTAYVTVRPDFASFNRQLRQQASSQARPMRALGSNLGGSLARGLSLGVKAGAVGLGAGLVYSLKKASDFEQQLSSLGSVSGATGKQMRLLSKQALKAGADTKFSALDAARAQTELAKGGLGLAKIMRGGLKSALALAAAGEMDLGDAASTTVNQMKLFGLRGKDAMKIADGLATAANQTTADVSDFALALRQGGSAAKTAGLSFSETITALEALAEVGIKGSDAGTSLKTALIQLASPSSLKATEMADKLGIKVFDASGNMKSLVDVSAILQKSLGGLTREQRIQAATTLVGQDGFRALLALYDAGPKKIAKMQAGLEKHGTAATVAKKKQDNLKGSVEQMTGSFETLGIQIGTSAIPEVRDLTDDITGLANKIGRIVGRDDLSLGDKLNRILKVSKVEARPWVDKIEAAIASAHLPERLGDLLGKAIGTGARTAAPLAAKAFIDGFLHTNAWGRLAIGAWLVSKMGGPGAFKRAGATGGQAVGEGMATGVATSGLKGRLSGMFRSWGPALAVSLAATLGPDFIKAITEKAHPKSTGGLPKTGDGVSKFLREGLIRNPFKKNGDDLREFGDTADATFARLRKLGDVPAMRRLADQARALAKDFPNAAKSLNHFADEVDGVRKPTQAVQTAISRMDKGTSSSLGSMRTNVRLTTKLIKNKLGTDTAAGKKALTDNFIAAARNVHRSMDASKISVKEGTAEIERLMLKALQSMGFSKKQAIRVRNGQDATSGKAIGGAQNLTGKQRGGMLATGGSMVVPGTGSGDKVHLQAMVEPGERVFVLNRNASKKLGALQQLNASVPRFQSGGLLPHLRGGGQVTGDTDFTPTLLKALRAMSAKAGVPIFVQSGRRTVAEQLAQGPSTPGHPVAGPNGPHVRGIAADITPGFGTFGKLASQFGLGFTVMPQEPWHIQLLKAIGGLGGAAAPKLKRLLASGPDSPLKALTQGALDTTHGAAQALLDAVASNMSNGTETGNASAGGQYDKAALKRLWTRAGGDGSVANLMAAIALAESGGNATAHNASGASGLWQILGEPFPGDVYDPLTNARMAVAKYQSQGLGAWEAYTNGNYRQYLQSGGLVGMLKGGAIGKALRKVQHGRTRKVGNAAVKRLVRNINGIDMPKALKADLGRLSGDADRYGDFAERANALTVTNDDGSTVEGRAGGKTQTEWLTAQLTALFEWRNRIIDAEKIVVAKREETRQLIEQARTRLAAVRAQIASAATLRKRLAKRLGGVNKHLEQARKHPKRNRELITRLTGVRGALRAQIGGIDGEQKGRTRVAGSLKDKILPALTGKREALNTARGDLLSNLETVQGIGSPTERLATLPPVEQGVLGGSIFDVQMRLRELTTKQPTVTDSARADAAEARADLSAELTREANLRTAVSEKQFDVFKNFPPFGGSFKDGGPVPGPPGAPRMILAHGGEHVLTQDETAAGGPRVRVIVEDHRTRVFVDDVEQIVDRKMRREARAGARGLPGQAGVLR